VTPMPLARRRAPEAGPGPGGLEAEVAVARDGFSVEASLRAEEGTTVALVGPNGAGKSTLVAVLAGLLRPRGGRVALGGRILDDPARGVHVPARNRPVGVVFQDLLLFPHLSALENVAFPLRARGVPAREARARAAELLERLGVAHRAGARPGALSGGEAQRVALARALVARPRLLLLDEPLAALDAQARPAVRALLWSVLAGVEGVRVLVTHDPPEALALADRVVVLEGGRVTQEGTPEEVRTAPRTRYAAEVAGLNLFSGRLEPVEPGVGRLRTEEGELLVAWPREVAGARARAVATLRPSEVTLHPAPPSGSARNVVAGPVQEVTVEGDRVRVRLASRPPLVAEVTPASAARLALRPGALVWASFKAVEVQVLPA
jgi:molybdate transport system ATP-binding protein